MVKLYAYDKTTLKVLAIIVGATGACVEHEASNPAHGLCNDKIAWRTYVTPDHDGICEQTHDSHNVHPDGGPVHAKITKPNGKKGFVTVPRKVRVGENVSVVMDSVEVDLYDVELHELTIPEDVLIIEAPEFDDKAPVGTPGGPRQMSRDEIKAAAAAHEQELLEKHGHHKPKAKA